jgi:hypothetical protein
VRLLCNIRPSNGCEIQVGTLPDKIARIRGQTCPRLLHDTLPRRTSLPRGRFFHLLSALAPCRLQSRRSPKIVNTARNMTNAKKRATAKPRVKFRDLDSKKDLKGGCAEGKHISMFPASDGSAKSATIG